MIRKENKTEGEKKMTKKMKNFYQFIGNESKKASENFKIGEIITTENLFPTMYEDSRGRIINIIQGGNYDAYTYFEIVWEKGIRAGKTSRVLASNAIKING
ncbi:MAG: hypothetical protein PHG66_05865 [Candidatus Colwellbacteria bacterium]|nr:hypothetical protein [Candidatus Colwellbacteria bacterium]